MKKFIGFLVALSTLATSLTVTASAYAEDVATEETATYASGDFNHDGAVNAKDCRFILRNYIRCVGTYDFKLDDSEESKANERQAQIKYFNEECGYTEEEYNALDIDNDGLVDTSESTMLMRHFIAIHFGYVNESDTLTSDVRDSENKYIDEIFGEYPEEEEIFNKYVNELEFCCSDAYMFDVAVNLGYATTGNGYIRELDDAFYAAYDEKLIEFNDINMGDSNFDGEVDAKDAVVVLTDYAQALANNTSDELYEVGDLKSFNEDMNYDSVIDSKDAVVILSDYAENLAENN